MADKEQNEPVVKKKRGRKKKSELEQIQKDKENENKLEETPAPKKRGRKPKGGKLTIKPILLNEDTQTVGNIILHLKCSMSDIDTSKLEKDHILSDPLSYKPLVPPNIMAYNNPNQEFFNYNEENSTKNYAYEDSNMNNNDKMDQVCIKCKNSFDNETNENENEEDEINSMKDINNKLKVLKLQLYKDSNPDKKSACFWCTCEFDNPCCYIPKYETDESTSGYGSFCRPECAVAYLLKENIDDSAKFERYQLLNKIYGKVYNFKKNIRPAPNPYYLLDKFYGNLTIQEYRKLMKSEHMLLILEKPLTRILPELHEDIDDSSKIGNNSNKTNGYKVKRQSEKQKGPTKNEIMKENFGF